MGKMTTDFWWHNPDDWGEELHEWSLNVSYGTLESWRKEHDGFDFPWDIPHIYETHRLGDWDQDRGDQLFRIKIADLVIVKTRITNERLLEFIDIGLEWGVRTGAEYIELHWGW